MSNSVLFGYGEKDQQTGQWRTTTHHSDPQHHQPKHQMQPVLPPIGQQGNISSKHHNPLYEHNNTVERHDKLNKYQEILKSVSEFFNYLKLHFIPWIDHRYGKVMGDFDQMYAQLLSKVGTSPQSTTGEPTYGELEQQIRVLEQQLSLQQRQWEMKTQHLYSKLSSEMSQSVSKDETSLENVSIKQRPVNIADEYNALCANEWYVAKDNLDNLDIPFTEEQKLEFLSNVLKIAEEEAKSEKKKLLENINNLLSQPLKAMLVSDENYQRPDIPENLKTAICDYLRIMGDSTEINELVKIITKRLSQPHANQPYITKLFANRSILSYVRSCAKIAWKMVLQRPAMEFRAEGVKRGWNDKTQEPHWGSKDPANVQSRVQFYVHPALYHGDILMVKGRVCIK